MKKIKCIDNNGYNITVGNEYNLIQESQDFYFLVNDNQKTVKYGKALFELIDDEQPIPVQAPEPVKLTEQQMIDSIVYSNGVISFKDTDNETITIENDHLDFNGDSLISCGIEQVTDLDLLIDQVNDACDDLDDDYIDLRKAIFRKIIQDQVINNNSRAMRIMSTTSNKDEDLLPVLDELAGWTSASVNNPNSGNNIKMWVFYTN